MNSSSEFFPFPHVVMKPKRVTCKNALSKVYFSKAIQILLILQFPLSLFSMIWEIIHTEMFENHRWLLGIEFEICGVLLIEVFLRLYLVGFNGFFSKCSNWIDLCIVTVCSSLLILVCTYVIQQESTTDEVLSLVILVIRNILIALRMVMIYNTYKKTKVESLHFNTETSTMKDIDGSWTSLVASK